MLRQWRGSHLKILQRIFFLLCSSNEKSAVTGWARTRTLWSETLRDGVGGKGRKDEVVKELSPTLWDALPADYFIVFSGWSCKAEHFAFAKAIYLGATTEAAVEIGSKRLLLLLRAVVYQGQISSHYHEVASLLRLETFSLWRGLLYMVLKLIMPLYKDFLHNTLLMLLLGK